jgi:GalNAc-alpha-(1->4)-GalNAc-alpha-(1->3)-diNAcBac-PP-undecaprenol alpha-1,4-N-acetyl-D-galactosaminyltransferase
MKRIVFVISDLEGGGAQRVAVELLGRWAAAGWDVHLVTIAVDDGDFFRVPNGVARTTIDRPNDRRRLRAVIGNNLDRLRGIRRIVRDTRPDAVVSFLDTTNVLTLLATTGLHVPIVVSERIDPRHQPLRWPWQRLREIAYQRAAAIVVQTESVRSWAIETFPSTRVEVLPNPAHIPAPAAPIEVGGPYVAAVGRLSKQKGFDLLIAAFASIADRHPEWHLVIAGEGPDRGALAAIAARCGVLARVHLVGRVEQVGSVLGGASVFALSSRHEGFPNALLEAMACGVACVATRCPSGPSEIITDGSDGLLVDVGSVPALATALDGLLADDLRRGQLGARARASVRERFALEAVGARWDELLGSVASR